MTPEAWAAMLAELTSYDAELSNLPVAPPADGAQIRAGLAAFDFAAPRPLPELTHAVATMLRSWDVQVAHPRHFGLFCPSVRQAGVIADALTALYNPQVGSWWYAAAANEIEAHTLAFFARLLGFDAAGGAAHFTSGGSEANLSAVLAALVGAFPAYAAAGLRALPRPPLLYLSAEAHDSFEKIAQHTGLGRQALRRVRTDARLRMDLEDLRRQLAADRAAGAAPFLVVGTAGTTGAGAVDPLAELAALCRAEGLWLHVDAAWGGGALLSPRQRGALDGIAAADSVTWDAHKCLPVPMGAGMFFAKRADVVAQAFAVETTYVPAPVAGTVDLYKTSLLWSRRCIGLKVFMTLAELGEAGVAALIDRQAAMGAALRERLAERGWICVNDSPMPLVCFTHPTLRAGAAAAAAVETLVLGRGRAWLSTVELRGERVLRACITSVATGPGDLAVLLEELDRCLAQAVASGGRPCASGRGSDSRHLNDESGT